MRSNTIRILIIDDDPEYRRLLALKVKIKFVFYFPYYGRDNEPSISYAENKKQATSILKKKEFDIILLDISLEDTFDGIKLCEQLKQNSQYRNIPIIFLTNHTYDDSTVILQCYAAGGQDYISKKSSTDEILAKIKCHLEIKYAREEIEKLLYSAIPAEIAKGLINAKPQKPQHHELVHVLFTDFVGFSSIANKYDPEIILEELDYCFRGFDKIIKKYKIEKIKTIGDSYMCASNVPDSKSSDPLGLIDAAIEIQKFLIDRSVETIPSIGFHFQARIGIHSGPVIAGVIGELKLNFDIWGDTVNIAKRVEGVCSPEKVCISETTYMLVKDIRSAVYNCELPLKNTNESIKTYHVVDI
jgi:class 3 adenylate cyclase